MRSTRPCPCVSKFPDLRLHVVGTGWWEANLHEYAEQRGAGDTVVFEGHVDEQRKHEVYEEAWVLALPSLKEGWGLVVGEAGMHGTPAVAYRSAGGTTESIADGLSGLLVDTPAELTSALGDVLRDESPRRQLAKGAREMSHAFTWEHAQESFAVVLAEVLAQRRVDSAGPRVNGVVVPRAQRSFLSRCCRSRSVTGFVRSVGFAPGLVCWLTRPTTATSATTPPAIKLPTVASNC